ncbi:hypothetical protein RFI_18320 [Reticulomyxa filosa]|uniref:Rho-GAP domain-containing protein n=1 Tax=Reticulomyxa filosa TaxID=46433 RepID=X6N0T5_RETFI|nr:hypothetical protein RFI_18320 [Reticulomyxa filosa]|eukprot:ETO18922.1 hypothetical protein RFI_18320 [Reticulomyxa filosa]
MEDNHKDEKRRSQVAEEEKALTANDLIIDSKLQHENRELILNHWLRTTMTKIERKGKESAIDIYQIFPDDIIKIICTYSKFTVPPLLEHYKDQMLNVHDGLHQMGIFRRTANALDVKKAKDYFYKYTHEQRSTNQNGSGHDSGATASLRELNYSSLKITNVIQDVDSDVYAQLIKIYFNEMQLNVFDCNNIDDWLRTHSTLRALLSSCTTSNGHKHITCAVSSESDIKENVDVNASPCYDSLCKQIVFQEIHSDIHRELTLWLCDLSAVIAQSSQHTLMGCTNMSIVLTPCLINNNSFNQQCTDFEHMSKYLDYLKICTSMVERIIAWRMCTLQLRSLVSHSLQTTSLHNNKIAIPLSPGRDVEQSLASTDYTFDHISNAKGDMSPTFKRQDSTRL